jgi:hypothetical protein
MNLKFKFKNRSSLSIIMKVEKYPIVLNAPTAQKRAKARRRVELVAQ